MLTSSMAQASNQNRYEYLLRKNQELDLKKLRSSDSYKRIFKICSTPLEFSKLQYVYAAASQVMSIATLDEDEINHLVESKYSLSQMLYKDLESKGFHQALRDCRYNSSQTSTLILSLLILEKLILQNYLKNILLL